MTSDDLPIREPDEIRRDCARKLRVVQVSEHFQAVLGCLLGEDWTTPRLVEMVITPDGHLLGRCDGEPSRNWRPTTTWCGCRRRTATCASARATGAFCSSGRTSSR